MEEFLRAIQNISSRIAETLPPAEIYTLVVRWVLPVLATVIAVRCFVMLLSNRKYQRVWGYLGVAGNNRIPLTHWENSIGRSKISDIVINLPFISRSHAVLSYSDDDGEWTISDLGSKGGVAVNGERVSSSQKLAEGDRISLAGAELTMLPSEGIVEPDISARFSSGKTFVLILVFQILAVIQLFLSADNPLLLTALPSYLLFFAVEIVFYLGFFLGSKRYLEWILLACFLCGLDLFLVGSAAPYAINKQLISIIIGMLVFTGIQMVIRNLSWARKLRYILAAGALALIAVNLVFGETINGAKNWIELGGFSFQPMEFVKIAFVLAGADTLDRLLTTKNLTAFIGFSGVCVGALVLMRDLGTAVIFFGAFLVVAFMRSGDIRTIALICTGAVLCAMAVISFRPYIASRFEAWGHVWEFEDSTGYQQTRTMIAAASGGLLGVGGGNGYLVNVPAADTDLVFGMICEEWGLIIAIISVLIIIFTAVFAVSMMDGARSSYYAIAACGASAIFLIQASLNVFGSLDILPLTGVTLPFISNGGSSMVVAWALLAFLKSADERRRPVPLHELQDSQGEPDELDKQYELDSKESIGRSRDIDGGFDEEAFFKENGWTL